MGDLGLLTYSALLLIVAYCVGYYLTAVNPIKIHTFENERMERLLKQCPSLQGNFWPLPIAFGRDFQLYWHSATDYWRRQVNWDREIFTLSDGQPVALDWKHPSGTGTLSELYPDSAARPI